MLLKKTRPLDSNPICAENDHFISLKFMLFIFYKYRIKIKLVSLFLFYNYMG